MAKLLFMLFLCLDCTALLLQQLPERPDDFLIQFVESFMTDNILIIRDTAGQGHGKTIARLLMRTKRVAEVDETR